MDIVQGESFDERGGEMLVPPVHPSASRAETTRFTKGGVSAELDRLGPLPHLKIYADAAAAGDPSLAGSIGEAQGTLLSDRVHEVWRFYRNRFAAFSDDTLKEHAAHFEKVIERFDPAYAEEIRGIARGAGLETWQAFALNSRTELINRAFQAGAIPGECTSVCFKDAGIMGQTWDWGVNLSNLMAAIEINRPDGHTVFFLGEPGIIGKMGVNSAGLGVALNILGGSGRCDGVPIHVLLRAALDSSSFDEALGRMQHAELGTMSNILMTDAQGNHALLEFHGGNLHVRRADGDVCHTNHYLEPGIEPWVEDYSGINSATRLERAREIIASGVERSVAGMQQLLSDRANGEHAISAAPMFYDDFKMTIGTIITAVMDLPNRTIHFAHISDGNGSFTPYTVKGRPEKMQ